MDYTKDWDRTIGNDSRRQYQICGKKKIVFCKDCPGKITCFVEDTIYRCGKHNTIPHTEILE